MTLVSNFVDFSDIEIVYDHQDFLVINKPAGLSVHKDQQAEGLLTGLARSLKLEHLYLVHRLDQMTSGLLILAKNQTSNRVLSQMFQRRDVQKYYIAISDKKPKKKQGLIKGDMEKGRGGSWKLIKSSVNPAITQFFSFPLDPSLFDEGRQVSKGLRLFLLKPHTGKTHQLRVALKSLGSAIVGDTRYATQTSNPQSTSEPKALIDRGYLHAWRLCFQYEGENFDLTALPDSGELFTQSAFLAFLESLGHPKDLAWPTI